MKATLAALALLALASSCTKDADTFPTGTYLMHGRHIGFRIAAPDPPIVTVTSLRDSLMTVERVSSTTIRFNGVESQEQLSNTEFVISGRPYDHGGYKKLTIFPAGDSIVYEVNYRTGMGSTSTTIYSGQRRR